jgi:Uma2 family endonuclease
MKTRTHTGAKRRTPRNDRHHEPTWEIATLFPNQGQWSEGDYLCLDTNHLVELSDGCLEVLPMPTTVHQLIVLYLYRLLDAFACPDLGLVVTAPLRVRLWADKFREPDVVLMLKENLGRARNKYWEGADLAMEVVSADPDDRTRDLVVKPVEYARAGIREYWIVDPELKQITILTLRGKKYVVAGEYKAGTAASRLLPGFSVDVETVFARSSAVKE